MGQGRHQRGDNRPVALDPFGVHTGHRDLAYVEAGLGVGVKPLRYPQRALPILLGGRCQPIHNLPQERGRWHVFGQFPPPMRGSFPISGVGRAQETGDLLA